MTAYGLGVQAAMIADNKARRADPLAYDKSILQRMAAKFDQDVTKRIAKVEKIKTGMEKRASLNGKKSLAAIFKKVAYDIKRVGNFSDENRLRSASILSSSHFSMQPTLATSYSDDLNSLRATSEYKNLLLAAKKNNIYIALTNYSNGVTLEVDVTKTFAGSPDAKFTKPWPQAPKSTP